MFCTECFCRTCPHELRCDICEGMLNGHLLIKEGCRGQYDTDKCMLDIVAGKHAAALRDIIKSQDGEAMEAFFDYKTGPWYTNPIRMRMVRLIDRPDVINSGDDYYIE